MNNKLSHYDFGEPIMADLPEQRDSITLNPAGEIIIITPEQERQSSLDALKSFIDQIGPDDKFVIRMSREWEGNVCTTTIRSVIILTQRTQSSGEK